MMELQMVFVRLVGEGTDVWRPTQARKRKDGSFELLPTPDYDPADETWEFPPGSIVGTKFFEDHLRAVKAP